MTKISAVIITLNEEEHITDLINNLSFVDEILFVDSYSTDTTFEIISSFPNVKGYQNKFKNFPVQKNFALSKASHDWVLFIDADERLTTQGINEILKTVKTTDKVAFWGKFQYYFGNKKIKYSGFQTTKTIRLFRKSKCFYDENIIVHEKLVYEGEAGILNHKIKHYSFRNYDHYRSKMQHYANLKAINVYLKTKKKMPYSIMIMKFAYRFINHYFLRLGFLDGNIGLQISYLNAYGIYYRYKKLKELHN